MPLLDNSTLPGEDENGNSYYACFDIKPSAKGRAHICFHGRLFGNRHRAGEKVVVKTSWAYQLTETQCDKIIKRCKIAGELANAILKTKSNIRIRFVIPLKVTMDDVATASKLFKRGRKLKSNDLVMIEERLDGFKNFTDSNGESCDTKQEVLEAFTHFTYVKSKGRFVICNLQGTLNTNGYNLTRPVIHSVQKEFGDTDDGIYSVQGVINNHTCNRVCRALKIDRLTPTAPPFELGNIPTAPANELNNTVLPHPRSGNSFSIPIQQRSTSVPSPYMDIYTPS